jgi:hypothetical protein
MDTAPVEELRQALAAASGPVVSVPALVKGKLVFPPDVSITSLRRAAAGNMARTPHRLVVEGAYVIRRPALDGSALTPTGEDRFFVFPQIEPRALIETDASSLTTELFNLPFREIADFVAALGEVVADPALKASALPHARATSPLDDRSLAILLEILPGLLDRDALVDAVERELGDAVATGVEYLDGWVPAPADVRSGMTSVLAGRVFGSAVLAPAAGARVRAMPTRQLHITSGNSPLVPFVSALRAFATKGAAVLKIPYENAATATLLAAAMPVVDVDHPLTRHTSIVHWPGGDREIEDVLLADGAFDRLVVWGSAETVRSIAARAPSTKTVFLNPRVGMSFIGHEAFDTNLREVAEHAAADSVIGNQLACTASLVHYVEASEADALAYCRMLRDALARWDREVPHALSDASLADLRRLRRGEFVAGTWLENGRWPDTTSAVVYMPTEFDLAAHPMCRCVVVRNVGDIRDALRFVHAGVSTIGVYPEDCRIALRDELGARGVSNVFPLGDCERIYAGMPHDGMRILSELVRWTNA